MSLAAVDDIAAFIKDERANDIAQAIHALATEVAARDGSIPTTRNGLMELPMENIVARLVMQHVFGSDNLVVSIHFRKVMCALDMFDWEETGVSKKDNVKMAKVQAKHISNSLQTWLPRGAGRQLQDSVDSLGRALGANKVGFWGQLTSVVNKHYSPKDKKILMGMLEDISLFYRSTKAGGRKQKSS